MKTRLIVNALLACTSILALALAACGAAATPVPASAPTAAPAAIKQPTVPVLVKETVVVAQATAAPAKAPEPTRVPAATATARGPAITQSDTGPSTDVATPPAGAATPSAEQMPPDMFFKTYGVNPFVDARQDHLSTFAMDVDTASYALARRYIMEGHLPPAEAVRVEEFVNYFKYD